MSLRPAATISFRELYVIWMAGLGGLLYGVDIGVIAAALPYISDTVRMTLAQTSFVVAAVLAGSSTSSVVGGVLADRIGRKRAVMTAALMFVGSIITIGTSQAYAPLLVGRFVQGMSGGIVAVVVPLYLAEELSAERRGRGTAIFQFSLTFGIAVAAIGGLYFTRQVERVLRSSVTFPRVTWMAEDHAWRSMFFALLYPGVAFLLSSFFLKESRYWQASRTRSSKQSGTFFGSRASTPVRGYPWTDGIRGQRPTGKSYSLWQRKYVIPFLLACAVLAFNQATGINSILSYAVLLLHEGGLSATRATQGDLLVKLVNCAFTLVAFTLIDRKGRKFLLVVGTGGIAISLLFAGFLFRSIEARSIDVKRETQAAIRQSHLSVPVDSVRQASNAKAATAYTLSVLYSYGRGDRIVSVSSNDPMSVVVIAPEPEDHASAALSIIRARLTPRPSRLIGASVVICLSIFIACFAVGPGVVVWLALSELMPTRIRSIGMGVALLLNQGVSTASAAMFLPVAGRYGNSAMLILWASCSLCYLIIAAFLLPETKGKSLEEIERVFESLH